MDIKLDFDIGHEVWIEGLTGEPERAVVEDIEVLVTVLPKGRRGRPCRTYKPERAVGTTKEQIEELIECCAVNKKSAIVV